MEGVVAERPTKKAPVKNERLRRCMDWLQKQNSQEPKKLSLQNKNDIQFIIQTNADRKNFLLSAAEDEATVPPGIDEVDLEPKRVPIRKLRTKDLQMECEWQYCKLYFGDYEQFQKHVREHTKDLLNIGDENNVEFVCLWDICGHKTREFNEMVRHINYHSYHARLLAIGFNGRATLKLPRCLKDSSKRNQLPPLKSDHMCMWTGCTEKFSCIQTFFDHVRQHSNYSNDNLCSWGGCGATFPRREFLITHVRTHTQERLIACYHCGCHFSCNRKLADHLRRQNVNPLTGIPCSICGSVFATEYLMRCHARQHVSAFACALCDMSAPTAGALAHHVRYRHAGKESRLHQCPHCDHRAVTKSDLRTHMKTHEKRRKKGVKRNYSDLEDDENSESETEKIMPKRQEVPKRKYACHMCPEKQMKIFGRGSRLTTHLVKVHGVQWPCGHSRFRYQISEDGMYRLTTTRYEFEDVSKKIVDGYSWPKDTLTNSFEFNLELKAEPTENTPRVFEITLKNSDDDETKPKSVKREHEENAVEITMCDVDEEGNIINSKVIRSDVLYT